MAFQVTSGNVEDRKPVPRWVTRLTGKRFGDRGYRSRKLVAVLIEQALQLLTQRRQGLKNKLLPVADNLVLRQRALIETLHEQLKNISQIAQTRHRSAINWRVNLLAGLGAYSHQPQKPSLNLFQNQLNVLNWVA